MSSYNGILLAFAIFSAASVYLNDAKIRNLMSARYNFNCTLPRCSSNDTNVTADNLITIESGSPESDMRNNFILSNIDGPPMVIIANTHKSSKLKINWTDLLLQQDDDVTSGLYFSQSQKEAIGIMCEKIFIFDDTDKNGRYTNGEHEFPILWHQIIWDSAAKTTFHKDDFLKTIFRMRPNNEYSGGTITVKLAIPNTNKVNRQKEVPHLKLNNQSISVVFIVDGIHPPSNLMIENPRLAMTFAVVIQSPTSSVNLVSDSVPLISDEYTPGVFRIKRLQFSENTTSPKNLGFLYWKEVAYTDRRKIISRTVNVYNSGGDPEDNLKNLSNISPPFYQFFKHKSDDISKQEHYNLYKFTLVFGKGDTLYSSTNFTDFSFVFGLGEAPQEQLFSFPVKVVIFLCFGVPLLVMLMGLGFLVLRNVLRKNDDSDLLLATEQ